MREAVEFHLEGLRRIGPSVARKPAIDAKFAQLIESLAPKLFSLLGMARLRYGLIAIQYAEIRCVSV